VSDDWATPADIRRAVNAEEAARAIDWQSEQTEIAAKRLEALELLRANPATGVDLFERWAALLPEHPRHREPRP
jgi:hypothetical protein